MLTRKCFRTAFSLVSLFALASCSLSFDLSEVDGLYIPATSVAPETTKSPTTAPPRTTTTLAQRPRVDDLPLAELGSTDSDAVKVAQALARRVAANVSVDGVWGSQTQQAVDLLRADYGLEVGGLDAQLWEAILSSPTSEPLQPIAGPAKIQLPKTAIYLDAEASGYNTSLASRFVLPFKTSPGVIASWIRSNNPPTAIGDWRWCESISNQFTHLTLVWWQRSGRQLSVSVVNQRAGRVDIEVVVEEGTNPEGCQGASRTSSDLNIDSVRYRYRDRFLDWEWRPTGTYTNTSDTTIVYYEVVFEITWLYVYSANYVQRIDRPLRPGQTAEIMRDRWFTLRIMDPDQQQIGLGLGNTGISYNSSVRYLEFEDGTTYGTPVP